MPKLSKASATDVQDHGMAAEYRADLDGYTTSFVEIREDVDLAPVLKGLPDDRCTCPHWGYLIKGRMVWTFADHEEIYEAGDAFYVPPGHTRSPRPAPSSSCSARRSSWPRSRRS